MIDASILRAMLAAGATAEMIVVAVEAAIECDRAKWRQQKMSQRHGGVSTGHGGVSTRQVGVSTRKKKGPHTPKEKTNPLDNPTGYLSPTGEDGFEKFWVVFPRKVGKGAARKAYRNALKRTTEAEIIVGAERYAAERRGQDATFTAHAATWLNADRWADEAPKAKTTSLVSGPWKAFEPEPPRVPRTPEEQAAIDARVRSVLRKTTATLTGS